MSAGIAPNEIEMVIESINEYAKEKFPDQKLLDLDFRLKTDLVEEILNLAEEE